MKCLLFILSTRNQSSWTTEEGPRDLQAGQEQAQPDGECVTSEEQPQPSMETKDQQERWQSTETKEIHPTESCQVTLGDREEGHRHHVVGGGGAQRGPLCSRHRCGCLGRGKTLELADT